MLCRCPVDHRRGTAQIFERLNSIIFCTLRHRSLQLGEDALSRRLTERDQPDAGGNQIGGHAMKVGRQ